MWHLVCVFLELLLRTKKKRRQRENTQKMQNHWTLKGWCRQVSVSHSCVCAGCCPTCQLVDIIIALDINRDLSAGRHASHESRKEDTAAKTHDDDDCRHSLSLSLSCGLHV